MIWNKKEVEDIARAAISDSMNTISTNLKVKIEEYWDQRMHVVGLAEKRLEDKGVSMQAKVDQLAEHFEKLTEISVASSRGDEVLQARLTAAESKRLEMAAKAQKESEDWRDDTRKHMEVMEAHAERHAVATEKIAEILEGFKASFDNVASAAGDLTGAIDDLRTKPTTTPKKKAPRG